MNTFRPTPPRKTLWDWVLALFEFTKSVISDNTIHHSENTKRSNECSESTEPVLFRIARSSLKRNTNEILKRVQDDMRRFLLDSNGNAILDKASSAGSVVASSFCLSRMTISIVALSVLAICIFTITPALSAFQCVECPENFFCKNGQKTACPASTPVTNGTQKSSESDCMTCYQKTGNSATAGFKDGICTDCYTADPTKPAWNGSSCTTCLAAEGTLKPVYSDLAGRCVSCGEKDSSTPNWNGTECVGCGNDKPYFNPNTLACEACPADKPNWDGTQCVTCEDGYYEEEITCEDGTEWNEETKECEATVPAGAIFIPTDNGGFYISEDMVFIPEAIALSTCQSMISDNKYPEVTTCLENNDYWAGAVKTCQDQGKRLPTLEELTSIAKVLYNNSTITTEYKDGLSISNNDLWNILLSQDISSGSTSYPAIYLWSSEEYNKYNSYLREFTLSSSEYYHYCSRGSDASRAICVPQ